MTLTDQIFNNNADEDNKNIYCSIQEYLDSCFKYSDSCINGYSRCNNKKELVLILDIQYWIYGSETYRRKNLQSYNKEEEI
jgi:hypothetical protein